MRLYDVQVMLSAANTADKQQQINQQKGQIAQSQNAININAQTAEKLSQPPETTAEAGGKPISPDDRKQKRWVKSGTGSGILKKENEEDTAALNGPSGRIIDIKI
jgi:hypothetical protein